jgi:NitT/TauT family transport system substrate-binding protein
MLAGDIDIAAIGTPSLLTAWERTKGREDISGLAALGADTFALETNKPRIKTLADFGDDDRIAVPALNSRQALVMRMASEQAFGDYHRIDKLLVSMPHPEATAALISGQGISGYLATAPFLAVLKHAANVRVVTTSRDAFGDEVTGVALGASKKFVDANPAAARAVIAATEDAMSLIASEPTRAADIYLASEASTISKEDVVDMLTNGSILYSVAPIGLMKLATFVVKTGELRAPPRSWQDVFFPLLGERKGT